MIPCQHIADYYEHKWQGHKCIAYNLLRRGYHQSANGTWRLDYGNNLYLNGAHGMTPDTLYAIVERFNVRSPWVLKATLWETQDQAQDHIDLKLKPYDKHGPAKDYKIVRVTPANQRETF